MGGGRFLLRTLAVKKGLGYLCCDGIENDGVSAIWALWSTLLDEIVALKVMINSNLE